MKLIFGTAILLVLAIRCESLPVGFIRVQDKAFVDAECMPFLFSGFESYETATAGAGLGSSEMNTAFNALEVQASLAKQLDMAVDEGLYVTRFFAHGTGNDSKAGFSESAFQALDQAISDAGKRGLRVILSFSRKWQETDIKKGFAAAAGLRDANKIFSDEKARSLYRSYMMEVVRRVNTVTRIPYRGDPTILGYSLMNHAHCDCDMATDPESFGCSDACADDLNNWVRDMSAFLKLADPNHLIAIGTEGFSARSSGNGRFNPDLCNKLVQTLKGINSTGSCWAQHTGQDFESNNKQPLVDFASFEIWLDGWRTRYAQFQEQWLGSRMDMAREIGKPLVLQSFGLSATKATSTAEAAAKRDPLFEQIYRTAYASMQQGDVFAGLLYSNWVSNSNRDPSATLDTSINVYSNDSTFSNMIRPYTKAINAAQARQPLLVEQCIPRYTVPGSAAAVTEFSTQFILTQLPWQLQANKTASYYETAGLNLLAKEEGSNVSVRPLNNATAYDCANACDAEERCDSFSHNPATRQCWLKRGSGNRVYTSTRQWQTYWKRVGVSGSTKACGTENCALCTDPARGWAVSGTCLVCYPGFARIAGKGRPECISYESITNGASKSSGCNAPATSQPESGSITSALGGLQSSWTGAPSPAGDSSTSGMFKQESGTLPAASRSTNAQRVASDAMPGTEVKSSTTKPPRRLQALDSSLDSH